MLCTIITTSTCAEDMSANHIQVQQIYEKNYKTIFSQQAQICTL